MDENQERIKKLEEIIQKYKDNPSRQKLVEGAQAEIRQLKRRIYP